MCLKNINGSDASQEEIYVGSLTERANRLVNDPTYMKRLYDIKKGKCKIKFMDFIMDGVKIGMPYNGYKLTQGYLKKETQSIGILLQRSWQPKFCILDLTKFIFKYAKSPTESFTVIHLKEIIDVVVEEDPKKNSESQERKKFSLTRKDKS
jgi:hypothetical protein